MPCSICNEFQGKSELLSQKEALERGINRHHFKLDLAWSSIVTSANSCYICDILVRGIRGCFHQHNIEESKITRCDIRFFHQQHINHKADGDKEIRFELSHGRVFEITLFAIESDDCPTPDSWESIPMYARTSSGTVSDQALAIVKSWISECDSKSHAFCDIPNETELPRRVLDVGRGDDEFIKVIETQGRVAPYVCLSHCWGQVQIMKSTRHTLAQKMAGIPLRDLSNTFRDAVLFTRRLGISYIWIDSLCIIQDDSQDWKVESAKMADIYSSAYLTIAATSSLDGRGGLFSQTPDYDVSGLTSSGEPYRLFFRERIDHHLENTGVMTAVERGHSTFTYHPLLTRAWVYQERLLSTRVLHFGHFELFFECRSEIQCECGGIRHDGLSSDVPVAVTKLVHADALDSILPGADWPVYAHYYIARVWRTMVASYTALDITFASDRLSAIGGLAKNMARRRKTAYLAGLWKATLSEDLLWVVWTPEKRPRPSAQTAPTWSWASVGNHIGYQDEIFYWDPDCDYRLDGKVDYEHFAKVKACTITTATVDEYGEIAEGRLQLTGLLAAGELVRETRTPNGNITHYVKFPNVDRVEIKADYFLDEPGPEAILPGTQVFCLRMSRVREGSVENLVSLVLKRLGNSPELYARFGAIYIEAVQSMSGDTLGGVFASSMETTVTIV